MEPLKVYITFLGRSIWAVINSYYAVLKEKEYQPDLIYLVVESLFEEKLQKTRKGLEILSEEFGFSPKIEAIPVKEAAFVEAGKVINDLIKKLKENKDTIAVDLTPGRKALIAGTLIPLSKIHVDYVFYLAINTLAGVNLPYEMIPAQIQSLKDFIEEEKLMQAGD